jgi:tetratricopeptide (TPR) repeat protein
MEIEDLSPAADYSEEERRARRRQLAQQAIALAMQSRWEEAADLNQQIVDMAPNDAEAFNRLGKANTELGRVDEAKAAYEAAMRADPANLIAQRNLERLSRITPAEAAELAKKATAKLDPRFFMEETGKTGITILENPVAEVLPTLTAGDQVKLEIEDGTLVVTTVDGTRIGTVEERLAARLVRLMQTGNKYQAGVVGVDRQAVRIIVRETYQSPQNVGRISFPPQVEALPRPYLRESLVRRGGAAMDEDDEEELDLDLTDDSDEDEDDHSEFGFHEASLDEV